ncbi:MAG: hypothetical protein HN686_13535, partial [Bacteroidetes bacterium]|nr:hypothetical protein [Bacteroidota bacterium]
MKKALIASVLIILISCQSNNHFEIPLTQVKRGTFVEELTEEGTVHAVNNTAVATPRISYRFGSMKISSIIEDGKEVQK